MHADEEVWWVKGCCEGVEGKLPCSLVGNSGAAYEYTRERGKMVWAIHFTAIFRSEEEVPGGSEVAVVRKMNSVAA